MISKRIAALGLSVLAQAATAAGAYDGIYLSTVGDISFFSVHQNASAMIAGGYGYVLSNGTVAFTNSQQVFKPKLIQEWVAYGGSIQGNVASLTGEALHGACNVTLEVHFSADLMTLQVKASAPTDAGVAQGYPCWTVLPVGTMFQYKKIF